MLKYQCQNKPSKMSSQIKNEMKYKVREAFEFRVDIYYYF